MTSQKRLVLFLVLSIGLMYGAQFVMDALGLTPPPPRPVPPIPAQFEAQAPAIAPGPAAPAVAATAPGVAADPAKPTPPRLPEPPLAKPGELTLGSADDPAPGAYRLAVRLDQIGAGVREILSSRYDGETADGLPDRKSRLHLIEDDPRSNAPASMAMMILPDGRRDVGTGSPEIPLDLIRWEVVRDAPDAPAVKSVSKTLPGVSGPVEGQEVAFRTVLTSPALAVTKRFRLWKGEDGFEMDLSFDGAEKDATVAYRLFGPHGIPIEGEWYTATFRDVFFGQLKGDATEVVTKTAADVVNAKATPDKLSFQTLPIKYVGAENQYFAVFLQPKPIPTPGADRWSADARAFIAQEDVKAPQKSDVGIEITSVPLSVGPNRPATHSYRVYAGPKTAVALAPFEATELASYRKYQLISIPGANWLAGNVIAPLLDRIYALTKQVANFFGFRNGNYGVAIILLTMTVRLIMFPLGRKQAMISKKMQDLQPHLVAIKEKHKDDKERQTKETLALYKQHGFNPAAGCLPSLIQLPIFVGLWQALNNSVALRHSTFLYIKNLAAPDMLFTLPTELPIVGKYFNLLPFGVVALMLVQTKLFSPPAITDEAKMQQKMMKYMMIFMAFMFYKVPSGLGIYFITSSSWQICERLLLPKLASRKKKVDEFGVIDGGTPVTIVEPSRPAGGGWLATKLQKLLDEAENQRTIRNNGGVGPTNGNGSARDRDRGRDGTPRDRPRPPRPGGKRRP